MLREFARRHVRLFGQAACNDPVKSQEQEHPRIMTGQFSGIDFGIETRGSESVL